MFCNNCGKQNDERALFCKNCGFSIKSTGRENFDVSTSGSFKLKKQRISFGVLILSLLLATFAFSQMGLLIVGSTTIADVYEYEQRIYIGGGDSTRDPTRYEVFYEFYVDGKRFTGSTMMNFPYGITVTSEGMPENVTVRYISVMPHINSPDGEIDILPFTILLLLSGLLLFIGLRGKVQIGYAKK